jgi:hypothetical protein
MMNRRWDLYDYVDRRGRNVIAEWVDSLQLRDQAVLDEKLAVLARIGPDQALHAKLLAGPLKNSKRKITPIYKIRVKGTVQLRPMLCRGPIHNDVELTLLAGAIEKGGKLDPVKAVELAEDRRKEILQNANRRENHE